MRLGSSRTSLLCLVVACAGSGCGQDRGPATERAKGLHPRAVHLVLEGMLSHNAEIRQNSFDLCERHWEDLRGSVRDFLESDEVPRRHAAAYLLSRLGGWTDAPLLRICLRDSSADVRLATLRGVSRLRDRRSVPLLLANLESKIDFKERRAVLDVIAQLDPGAALEVCLKFSDRESWAHRRNAAETMGCLDDGVSEARLVRMLSDSVWMVRSDAAYSLARRGVTTVGPHLVRMAKEKPSKVRIAATYALGALRRPEDLELLRRLASGDPDKRVRHAASGALGQRSPGARPLTESRRD